MRKDVDLDLRSTVERYVRNGFPDARIDDIIISERVDADGDMVVDVVVVLSEAEQVTGFSRLARNLWAELSEKDFGFPILSFRTKDENAQILAAA